MWKSRAGRGRRVAAGSNRQAKEGREAGGRSVGREAATAETGRDVQHVARWY